MHLYGYHPVNPQSKVHAEYTLNFVMHLEALARISTSLCIPGDSLFAPSPEGI
jgi:hypothetical protein